MNGQVTLALQALQARGAAGTAGSAAQVSVEDYTAVPG